MLLKDIVNLIENKYPKELAYDWDNVGLIIGNLNAHIKNILIALDATDEVIQEAIENNVDLIITHHPFVFKPIKKITSNSLIGKNIYKLIKNDINIYCCHTNFDIAYGGLNDAICDILGLKNLKLIEQTKVEKLYKIVVYTPISSVEKVREALSAAGAGHIGNYSHCTFNTEGVGTFMPLENTNPHIGEKFKLEKVQETKIETICKESILDNVINNMIKNHPYEEVAYDVYELKNSGIRYGLGRIGTCEENYTLRSFTEYIKEKFSLESVKVVGDLDRKINKVAVVSGSGSSLICKVSSMNADVLITGDIKYHEAQQALESGVSIIDIGHFGSEKIFSDILQKYLQEKLENVNIIKSKECKDPFKTI
ncbi:dinuclear metal center protein, YbgI/SA1388 family [Alkalithermobacter thermoalcaliphilus JW-YL-7 = DSM 7308]|uniref:GTP cyclohydrolase 1 type 2 homolog n=1 Tax=Alkalithermobacter thermoalcaliphilus JW-YL-7 = DSM 7308 TaxID=1121328 RepID=A0A150FRA4_CLOPD|nr:NGG1p interacting factor 3 protein, NIF3 [[Clostridium] paradoxum JW-YL-7 = DSM 7308]SHK62376.1 dinuclear metal center protein, YbgI/SA1388 family [[Clostridium] paradoxum JW-YL-7 = DSM 7308]